MCPLRGSSGEREESGSTAYRHGEDQFEAAVDSLSRREREVLHELAMGRTNSSIARAMNLSPHTVDAYLRRIRAKTGIVNRAQLILLGAFVDRAEFFEG